MRIALTVLQMAVVEPMPNASVSTVMAVNPGVARRRRAAYRMSAAVESTPFSQVTNPPANGGPGTDDGHYWWNGTLPSGKSGRHLVYSVWSRSDSQETFYGCSDVVFDGTMVRKIHVDVRYMLWIMDKIDGADHLLEEMGVRPQL